jgi:lipopolysaccharide heptosyltransferase II
MKLLLVRLRLIGDVVLTTPLVSGLRRRFPDATLTYVVEPDAAPVLAMNPHLTELIVTPRRRGIARVRDDIRLARQLRRTRFDVAIDLHGGPRSAWLTWASGAPMRIGYAIAGRAWMYTHVVPRSPDLTPRHSVANQWDLLAPLGIDACDPARDALSMPESPEAAAHVSARLTAAGIGDEHTVIVVHVSAGNPFRRWPTERFTELVVGMASGDPRRRIVLNSGPSDWAAARHVASEARRQLGPLATRVPDIGEFDLAGFRALVARAAVYIGGDTGPTHVAATTTTPIVELLGPTLPERSAPWRDPRWFSETVDVGHLPCRPCHQRHCEPGDFRCLTRISVNRVIDAAERALTARGGPGRIDEPPHEDDAMRTAP